MAYQAAATWIGKGGPVAFQLDAFQTNAFQSSTAVLTPPGTGKTVRTKEGRAQADKPIPSGKAV